MTRDEHIKWCKDRAIKEYDSYAKEGHSVACQNGCTSMASDLKKHPETGGVAITTFCIMSIPILTSRQSFVNFINGFN